MNFGKNKEFVCKNCTQNFIIKINKVYAKESKNIAIISGLIFLIGSAIAYYYVFKMISEMKSVIGIALIGSGLLIPIWIFSILNKEQRMRTKTFNQTYVSEE